MLRCRTQGDVLHGAAGGKMKAPVLSGLLYLVINQTTSVEGPRAVPMHSPKRSCISYRRVSRNKRPPSMAGCAVRNHHLLRAAGS